jgi:hypothetical protein
LGYVALNPQPRHNFFEAVDQPLALYWRVVKWCGFVEFQRELRKKMQKSGNLQKI